MQFMFDFLFICPPSSEKYHKSMLKKHNFHQLVLKNFMRIRISYVHWLEIWIVKGLSFGNFMTKLQQKTQFMNDFCQSPWWASAAKTFTNLRQLLMNMEYMLPPHPPLSASCLFVLHFLSVPPSCCRPLLPSSLSRLKARPSHGFWPVLWAVTDPLCHLYHSLLHCGLLNHSANCRSCGSLWLCSALSTEMRINTDTR